MRSNIIDLEVIFIHATEKAVLVKAEEDSDEIWLPLSQVEIDGFEQRGEVVTISLPQPLAEEKGLV